MSTIIRFHRPAVKPTRRTPRPPAPFAAGVFGYTPADEAWWQANCPVQAARVWQDGLYTFEPIERPEIDKAHPDRFTLSTWYAGELISRQGYGDERSAILAADVTADPLQWDDEPTVDFSDDANGQFGYTREEVCV